MQTSAPNVWAAADVIGEPMLETIAAKKGAIAANNAFSSDKKKINFNGVPGAVFTYPEVASVGLTDAEANGQRIRCTCSILLRIVVFTLLGRPIELCLFIRRVRLM